MQTIIIIATLSVLLNGFLLLLLVSGKYNVEAYKTYLRIKHKFDQRKSVAIIKARKQNLSYNNCICKHK